jgi:hypothetical protein
VREKEEAPVAKGKAGAKKVAKPKR